MNPASGDAKCVVQCAHVLDRDGERTRDLFAGQRSLAHRRHAGPSHDCLTVSVKESSIARVVSQTCQTRSCEPPVVRTIA